MDRTLLFKTSELNLVDLYGKCIGYIGDKYTVSYMDSMGMWVSFVLKVLLYRMNCVLLFSLSWGGEENCTYPINRS